MFVLLNRSSPPTSRDHNANGIPDECENPQLPSDCNQDGTLDLSDAICLLGHLFRGQPSSLPCGDGTVTDPGDLALLDANGDAGIDLSDPIRLLAGCRGIVEG